MLADLEAGQAQERFTQLRISGAIQVLEELRTAVSAVVPPSVGVGEPDATG